MDILEQQIQHFSTLGNVEHRKFKLIIIYMMESLHSKKIFEIIRKNLQRKQIKIKH